MKCPNLYVLWSCKDFVTIPIFPFFPRKQAEKKRNAVFQSNTLKIADIINYMASSKPIASVCTSANLYIFFSRTKATYSARVFRLCIFSLSLSRKKGMPLVRVCVCAYGAKIYVMEINVNKMKNQAHVRITWVRICCMAIIWKRIHTHACTHTYIHTVYSHSRYVHMHTVDGRYIVIIIMERKRMPLDASSFSVKSIKSTFIL